MSQHQSLIPLNEHLRNIYADALLTTKAEAIFFSSFESAENVLKKAEQDSIIMKVMLGKYDNQHEMSYIIAAEHLSWLIESSLVDGQESLMLVNNECVGYLMYNQFNENGELRIDDLGPVLEISKEDAANRSAFTFDPADGLYYGTIQKTG